LVEAGERNVLTTSWTTRGSWCGSAVRVALIGGSDGIAP
jgi:hypothetical protein